MKYIEPLFRPPAEADSLIFQVSYGCPHNGCRFCGMYKSVRYHLRDCNEVLKEIEDAGKRYPDTRRVFLADGDVMALPHDVLVEYLKALNRAFPRLARVNIYANGSSILKTSDDKLKVLRSLKLQTLYMGLESGAQKVLDAFNKNEQASEMIEAVNRAQQLRFKCSVMILVGLGGTTWRDEHIAQTVAALNLMQPKLLSALRFIQVPGLKMPEGYVAVSEYQAVEELREIIKGLQLQGTVFRANHTSNPLPLAGRFPGDREQLLQELNYELQNGNLERFGSGKVPWFL